MSSTQKPEVARYMVIRREESAGERHELGTIAIDQAGVITILSIANDPDERLAQLVDELNRRAHLNVKVPPAPGAPRFALSSRIVERGTPDFIPALVQYLQKYHMIELRES
jgi:hypothetical protein